MNGTEDFEDFISGVVLELDIYEGDELAPVWETIEAWGERDGLLGYVGSRGRNYLTDEWALQAMKNLGWNKVDLVEWACSKAGRFTIEAEPHSLEEMQNEMWWNLDQWRKRL